MILLAVRDRFNSARDRRKAMRAAKPKPIRLRPDPQYRENKLAQYSPERRARYWENVRKAGL